jgi:transposase
MQECILVGCDLHDKTMLLKIARGRAKAVKVTWANNVAGRRAMLKDLQRRSAEAQGAAVRFAYEASGLGFGLHDLLVEHGMACSVLAPTKMPKSVKHRQAKCDERDAEQILDLLRGHVLAGNALPEVWIPDRVTREDREVMRARLDAKAKATTVKTQVQTLLKRNGIDRPPEPETGKGWTLPFRQWLARLTGSSSPLSPGARVALGTLLRQLAFLEHEAKRLDRQVEQLAQKERYAEAVEQMKTRAGVGTLTAMVFLTELGDLTRFTSRKEVGAFLGLVPSSDDTAESDRKGHITHQGPWRVRWILCQATWTRLRTDPEERHYYDHLVAKNPKHKKIAVVACMRRLAIRLWHIGSEVQRRQGVFEREFALVSN